ncbi:hypothetical protein FOY51_12245 [Antrihabitans cavernicola]|uniref:Uncharacterized protein n=1 Tax=Antrihabitans cavernicola TaxID=2495913 RepID=A0A5A7SAG4_9NOCA|nr:hypothetical protein [Spelaeibacter cavernicola]KAA0022474.1 hypothetical protein FOY51_12245 [Spelaeibacter cavernicola]
MTDSAQDFDTFAAELERAQTDMQTVRVNASGAGLTVVNGIIEEPGPAPPSPGAPPTGSVATPAAVGAFNAALLASNNHVALVKAYADAQSGADAARLVGRLATDTLKNVWGDIKSKWFFTVSDLVNGGAATLAAAHWSTLLKKSEQLADDCAKFLDLAKNAPPGTSAATIYRDVDLARDLRYGADDAAAASAKAEASAAKIGSKIGGGLALAGIAYDISQGKPVEQAVVSGGIGFGASVAAGAIIGTAIPVPILGTAAGAAAGAIAGLFASGAVDSMYQNGFDSVGGAISDGASAVGDTGKAVGGLAKDAWDAIF